MNPIKLSCIFTALMCFLLTGASSQQNKTNSINDLSNLKFRRYSIEHGLSQVSANCILQDNKGYIWIGTKDGLNRFDGYTFTIFRHNSQDSTSLTNNWVTTIYQDQQNRIWVGTRGGGLNLLDAQTQTFFHFQHDANNPASLSNNSVSGIIQDRQNRIWVGTEEGGLNLLDTQTQTFSHFQHDPNNPASLSSNNVKSIFEDRQNRIWVGTEGGGLNRYDSQTKTFTHFQHDANNPTSLSNNTVWCVSQDQKNRIWVGTDGGGIDILDQQTMSFSHFRHDPNDPLSLSNNSIRRIYQDQQNRIWIGTDEGLNLFDSLTQTFSHLQHDANNPASLSHNRVLNIFQDKQNKIWIGTDLGGLNLLNLQTQAFSHIEHDTNDPSSLSNNSVWSIFQDRQNRIWVGTKEAGLNLSNPQTGAFSHFQHDPDNPHTLSSDFVMSIYQDRQNRIWVGTIGGGLDLFDPISQTFSHFRHDPDNPLSLSNNSIVRIFQDRQRRIWIGTDGGGLNLLDSESQTFIHFKHGPDDSLSLSNNRIRSIFQDQQNRIWVGTRGGGLNLFDPKTKEFSRFEHDDNNPASLSNNIVYCILQDQQNRIWIGTEVGLNLLDPMTATFNSWSEKHGLSNESIYGILEDDKGNLWLSTNKGINKFNPETDQFTWYDEKDGLQSNEFNAFSYFKDKDGKMYFGGVNGFNIFHPDSIKDNTYIPPVVITDFLLFNESVAISDSTILNLAPDHIKEITLEHDEFIFAFEFSALNYRQPEKNQFAYKLEGFNEDWIYTNYKDRKANYSNVSPGTYTFRVKASNDDGYWNEEGASITVIILPPWWLTTWAKILWVSLFIAIPLAIYKSRVNRLNWQKIKLEKEVENRTSEVNQQKEELTIQTEQLLAANQEISKRKDSYKADYESIKTLSEIGAKIISSLSIDTIIDRVYDSVNNLLSAESLYIGIYNKDKNAIDFSGGIEKGKKMGFVSFHLDDDSARITVQCFKKKDIISSNDFEKDYPNYTQAIGDLPLSFINIPLMQKTKVIGVLEVSSFVKNAYTDYHFYLLKNLASYISIAIENAQTFDKLEKSYAQLQELDEYKEAMTGMIVHDFKNALNTVISFSEGTPTERRLKSIRQAGQFMLNMVLNMLDVQKFETTDIKLAPSNDPISKVINEAVNQLSYMLEQKSIKLKYNPNNVLEANYDYELTTRIIVNILSNAIKYVPTNGNIEITTDQVEGFVKTSIRDNGPGIPADKIDMVFDKYSQINAKASGSVRSTGIGLTFCKMVVEAQGGTIGVTSEEGKGSNFYFTLPLSEITKEQKPTSEKVKIELAKDKSMVLSEKDKKILAPIIDQLKQWEVYDYSEVTAIIERVNSESGNINTWKELLIKALQNVNEEQYNELIKLE